MKSLSYLDRKNTLALKGVVLICMFVHHFFTFPGYLIKSIQYSWIREFASNFCVPFKICVPVFAFITGYLYAFSKKRSLSYSIKKITDLYTSYLVVYFLLLAVNIGLGCYEVSLYAMAFEIAALRMDIMVFCWYVAFYTYALLLLPFLTRSNDHSPVEDIFLLLILPVTITNSLSVLECESILFDIVIHIRDWFPCMACGYLFAKYTVFETFFDRIVSRFHHPAGKVLIWFILIAAALIGRYYCQSLHLGTLEIRRTMLPIKYTADIFYAPMFVYGCAKILQCLNKTILFRFLEKIGQKSMLMWLFHCAFFNPSREYVQPILYFPRNPVLVVIWGLILCYGMSVLIEPVIGKLTKLKNNILSKILPL